MEACETPSVNAEIWIPCCGPSEPWKTAGCQGCAPVCGNSTGVEERCRFNDDVLGTIGQAFEKARLILLDARITPGLCAGEELALAPLASSAPVLQLRDQGQGRWQGAGTCPQSR